MGSIRPNLTHVGQVGLDWTYVMDWVRLNFFLTHHDGLGQKISLRETKEFLWWKT